MKNALRALALLPVLLLASCGSTVPAEAQPAPAQISFAKADHDGQLFVVASALQGAVQIAGQLYQANLLTGQDVNDLGLIFKATQAAAQAGDYDTALGDLALAYPILNTAAARTRPVQGA